MKKNLTAQDPATNLALVSEIFKFKRELSQCCLENRNQERKRNFPNRENSTQQNYIWLCRARANKILISGALIQEKASENAKEKVL